MRPHGRATANRHKPRAFGVCDGCGFLYNKHELQWQYEWAGNRLVNQNMLVCETCYDKPQEQLRVIVLPADPTPIINPRPENYAYADNPITTVGINIGSMTQAAGINAAFDSNTNKPFFLSACQFASAAGLNNWVGKNWNNMNPNSTTSTFTASRFVATAPNNARFLASGPTSYQFQGSNILVLWNTLASGATTGAIGETIDVSITPTTGYLYHRFVLSGDGTSVSIAQLKIYAVS